MTRTIESKLPGVACFSHPTGSPEQISSFFFGDYDGTFISADGKYALDTAKAVVTGQQIAELWKHLPKQGNAMSFDEANAAFRDGKALDFSKGFASRPQLRGSTELAGTEYEDGWGAPCYVERARASENDKSFRSWTCAEGLACEAATAATRIGMCFVKTR